MHTSPTTTGAPRRYEHIRSRCLLAVVALLAACELKGPDFFAPQKVDDALFRSCTLVSSAFSGVRSSVNVGDAVSGQFTGTSISVLGGCDARRATYAFTSSNPSVATIGQTPGTTPTQSANAFGLPVIVVPVGAGSATLTGTITLDDGKTSTASVPITVVRPVGNLTVTVSGLPSGTPADVAVVQGTTTAGRLTATGTLSQLSTGVYTITASAVTAGDGTAYDATPASQQVTVVNQGTANASVLYAPQVGALRVTIDGLPAGAAGAVTLTRGSTIIRTIASSTVIEGLNVGAYTLTVNNVIVDGVTYAATTPSRTVTVAKGTEVTALVSYAAVTGKLNVRVSGLPSGVNADVRVSQGNTSIGTATGTSTNFDNIAPGSYTVVANSVTSAGVTYVASPATQAVSVTAGSTATATVSYAAQIQPTRITLTATGLPAGSTPQLTITGPGFTRTVNVLGPIAIDVPAAGTYTIAATRYTVSPTEVYDPELATRQVVVTAQQNVAVAVPFIRLSPVALRLSGLPANAAGPTGQITNGTDTYPINGNSVTYVRPGTYDVTLNSVAVANSLYRALTPVQRIVVAGSGIEAIVFYVYYLAEVQYLLTVQTGIFSDPQFHRLFVNMFVTEVLRALFSYAAPAAASLAPSALIADPPPTVTITGPSPWITVSGPRADDGTITLTGSGTAAGFANVPARLTGVMSSSGSITGGRLQYGQSTPPTGLPNGPIIYTISATGAPATSAASLAEYVRQRVQTPRRR